MDRDDNGGVITVICLDPHELLLAGLRLRLEVEPGLRLAFATRDPSEVIAAILRERPSVLVTEIDIEGLDIFSMIARIARHHPATRTVIHTAHPRFGCVQAAVAAGAIGFFSKNEPSDELVAGVRAAPFAESPIFGSTIQSVIADSSAASGGMDGALSLLTRREVEVLCLIGRGMSRLDIATMIRRSPKTVDAHRSAIMSKLGFKDRVELARFAIREGLVSI